jgi:putative two-component system response regulator
MGRPRILIADDDRTLRVFLGALAEQCGFDVLLAEDGAVALELARRCGPAFVVTDLHMPILSGQRLIPLLRALPGMVEVPVMVVSADPSRTTKVDLLKAGADDFIQKPVDPEEFMARLLAMARRGNVATELYSARAERDLALVRLEQNHQELERLTIGLVAALERASELNDTDTGNHIRRVSAFAAHLARAVGQPAEFVDALGRYAGLHDVGKVGIRDAILKKPGPLTALEFDEMMGHTLIGADLLRSAGLPEMAANIPLCHHEKWNGRGYPRGLEGEQIPIEARIVAVVDVFDALNSRRCYKAAFGFSVSCQMLREMAGRDLDPMLVEVFFRDMGAISEVMERFSDNG